MRSRLHTIGDPDRGVIPDNRSGATTLGAQLPIDTTATKPFYFGGANVRSYIRFAPNASTRPPGAEQTRQGEIVKNPAPVVMSDGSLEFLEGQSLRRQV